MFLSETWREEGSADKMYHPPGYLYENVFRKSKKRKETASDRVSVYH